MCEIRDIVNAVHTDIRPAVESSKLILLIDNMFPFTGIATAFDRMEANRPLGKIVVTL